jgi:hypothetical protein
MDALASFPSAVLAYIRTVPGLRAVTFPVAFTLATAGELERQVTLWDASAGVTRALNWKVCPR